MAEDVTGATSRHVTGLEIGSEVVAALRDRLPSVATATVGAITLEVPSYTGALSGSMGENIEAAVQMALGGFLKLASHSRGADPSTPLGPTLQGAYALGRGEARSGRSMDALLAAYRVGARVAWRELAAAAGAAGIGTGDMARFAELVFAYIDELSAASVAGHTDELTRSGRVRERFLERLGQQLLTGAAPDTLVAAADSAGWPVPRTLTAVLVASVEVRRTMSLLAALGQEILSVGEDLPGLPGGDEPSPLSLLLVPDAEGAGRRRLLRVLGGTPAVVGPARPWERARTSYQRALRTFVLLGGQDALVAGTVDSEQHLADLVVGADREALEDLRTLVLAPLGEVKPGTADRLAETLRSWLLHQGRRDAVAADLHVHPQTVRYRMGQLREMYGESLDDPRTVLELVLALHGAPVAGQDAAAAGFGDSPTPGLETP